MTTLALKQVPIYEDSDSDSDCNDGFELVQFDSEEDHPDNGKIRCCYCNQMNYEKNNIQHDKDCCFTPKEIPKYFYPFIMRIQPCEKPFECKECGAFAYDRLSLTH